MRIKKGDTIKVLMGKEKGKTGKVETTYPAQDRVLVLGINEFKRHVKSKSQNQKSEIMTLTKPMRASIVSVVCPKCKKTTRIGIKEENGKKIRICRKCLKGID